MASDGSYDPGTTARAYMRSALRWLPILVLLVAGCVPFAPPSPTSTPASLKPSNLLTPRPMTTPLPVEATPVAFPGAPTASVEIATAPSAPSDATAPEAHGGATGEAREQAA